MMCRISVGMLSLLLALCQRTQISLEMNPDARRKRAGVATTESAWLSVVYYGCDTMHRCGLTIRPDTLGDHCQMPDPQLIALAGPLGVFIAWTV
jgi:hypothetical protein